jgi:hypothetical protein
MFILTEGHDSFLSLALFSPSPSPTGFFSILTSLFGPHQRPPLTLFTAIIIIVLPSSNLTKVSLSTSFRFLVAIANRQSKPMRRRRTKN